MLCPEATLIDVERSDSINSIHQSGKKCAYMTFHLEGRRDHPRHLSNCSARLYLLSRCIGIKDIKTAPCIYIYAKCYLLIEFTIWHLWRIEERERKRIVTDALNVTSARPSSCFTCRGLPDTWDTSNSAIYILCEKYIYFRCTNQGIKQSG
jgi:hypothetical protein